MTKLFLAAGVAALAIAAPASADPGGNKGKGHSAKSQSAKANKGGGKAHARAENRGGKAKAQARADNRGGGHRYAMVDRNDKRDRGDRKVKINGKDWDRADRRVAIRDRDRDDGNRFARRYADARGRGLVNGCPPGLFAKNNGCLPPGQAKKQYIGQRIPDAYRNSLLPLRLRNAYRDNDDYYYRYGDGNLYQIGRRDNLVSSLLPLLAGGLGIGQAFPSSYSNFHMPSNYSGFYPDSQDSYYRYANGNVYGIDRGSGLIQSLIPLLAGGYGVGQMLPSSYSAYNVPYQYRDYYQDDRDYSYRYGQGAIYRVDNNSNLVDSVVALLANDMSVGQRLPMGYDAYNVPMAYRDRYYDSPNAMYRYNDGNIYQVNPTTQLITAIISAIV